MEYKILQYQKEVFEKGKAKPVNLIHGEEEYLVKSFTEKLRKIYKENYIVLWGDEAGLEDLYIYSKERSIFSGVRIKKSCVVMPKFEDFLKKLGRSKKAQNTFLEVLKKIKDATVYFIVERKLTTQDLSKEPFKTISTIGDIIVADRLTPKKIRELVKRKLEREAGGIEEEALDLLIDMCNSNLMVLKQETEKLINYAGKRKITVEDVRNVCFPWENYNLFELIDSFFDGDLERTLRLTKDAFRRGILPLQIQATLVSYLTKLYFFHKLIEKGENPDKALEKVGVKHSFMKLKFKGYSEKVDKEKAFKLLESLQRIDVFEKLYFINQEKALLDFFENALTK